MPTPTTPSVVRRAGIALVALGVLGAATATLWPFAFDTSAPAVAGKWAVAEWELVYVTDEGEIVLDPDSIANLTLLVPVGIGWSLARRGRSRRGRSVWRRAGEAALLGLSLSALFEALQLLTPERVTQLADLWRNACGCLAGAAVTAWVDARFDSGR